MKTLMDMMPDSIVPSLNDRTPVSLPDESHTSD